MAKKNKMMRRERSELKGRMRSFLMFLPNLVAMLARMIRDSRVPAAEKALFIGAVVYVISPLDLIPDILPFVGQVDDLYVVALTLLRLISKTDASIVRQHWHGGGDVVALVDTIVGLAPKFIPKRVARILTTRVELAPAGKILRSVTHRDEALVREIGEPDEARIDAHSAMAN
jgi:uncharacterized membrane protein YkvA (DUF1232 family)